ncbi:MAG: M48 family metallopeptidase [Deltaproteobacteria bacterium]|nr:M48 family metallopeptidase [Deltaproteobacteria bacterium]
MKPPSEILAQLNRDGAALAARFGLQYRAIEAELPRVKRRYGVCFADGTIRIRLTHATSGGPLAYSSLVNTLCHELAHLRHFNHGARFKRLYREILEHARAVRIYRPGAEQRARPLAPALPHRVMRGAPRTTTRLAGADASARRPLQLALFEADSR